MRRRERCSYGFLYALDLREMEDGIRRDDLGRERRKNETLLPGNSTETLRPSRNSSAG
jgi:hypothetical protein